MSSEKKIFFCKICNYKTKRKSNYEKHMNTKKHLDNIKNNSKIKTNCHEDGVKITNIDKIYECTVCDFKTDKKYAYERHKKTVKHRKLVNKNKNKIVAEDYIVNTPIQNTSIDNVSIDNTDSYMCTICMKKYKYKSGLSRHRKRCLKKKAPNKKEQLREIVSNLNNEGFIVDLIKKHGIVNQTVNNYSNYYNEYNTIQNQFNLNIFLNQHCKNAMNIQDFIDSINYNQLSWDNLLKLNGNNLYQNFSNMVIKQLNDIDMEKRPIHCTDKKRNTVYIKDNDIWERDKDCNKLTNVVHTIQRNQEKIGREKIQNWRKEHPEWKNNDQLSNLLYTASSNLTECNNKVEIEKSKLVKRITENIIIDKNDNIIE